MRSLGRFLAGAAMVLAVGWLVAVGAIVLLVIAACAVVIALAAVVVGGGIVLCDLGARKLGAH